MTICVHFGFNEVSSLEDFLLHFSIRFCAKDSHVVAVILEFRSTQKQIFGRVTPK
jgi:urate oxidase